MKLINQILLVNKKLNKDEVRKPPSDEGGGKTVGFDGGRENT